jgi:hypothetical protein
MGVIMSGILQILLNDYYTIIQVVVNQRNLIVHGK